MLAPWAITIRRPSGEADFILTRVDSGGDGSASNNPPETMEGNDGEKRSGKAWVTPFQRPKANSSSCITDGIKARFVRLLERL